MSEFEFWLETNSLIDLPTARVLTAVFILIGICWGMMDSIAHYDGLANWGHYWSYDAYTDEKTGWFDAWLPMFKDAWHLLNALIKVLIGFAVGYVCDQLLIGAALLCVMNIFFYLTHKK